MNILISILDWIGQEDVNGNECEQSVFATDFRSQHSFRELISWGISGSASGYLSPDIDINLSWDSGKLISNSDNFQILDRLEIKFLHLVLYLYQELLLQPLNSLLYLY